MNDRYLYRAKHVHAFDVNKKYDGWVYGYLSCENYIYSPKFGAEKLIDPNTICQCTGLKDKNGKMIWENDICRRILLPTKRIKTNFKIAYVPYKCCISAIDLDGSNITFLSDYINNQYEVEVIGNIFDNPELLEK